MTHRLAIEIGSYWHPGTGRGQGSQLDATTHRGADGLPRLPGRTVKGLLRDAVHRWESFGGYGGNPSGELTITEQLFGPRGKEGAETWPGLLRVSDATLPEPERGILAEIPDLARGLYSNHFSTRIDHASGTAQEKSLRGIELVVPLTLYATIETVATATHSGHGADWPELLEQALPLIRAVGAQRSRGLGRATLTLESTRDPEVSA